MLWEKHRLRKGEKEGNRLSGNCLQDRHINHISPSPASQNVNIKMIGLRVLSEPLG